MATKEQLIAAHIKWGNEISRIEEEQIKPLKDKMKQVEVLLAAKMDADGEQSIRTDEGTSYFSSTDFCSTADAEALFEFVKKEQAWDLIEKRASKTGVRAFIKERKELPPGVNYGQKRSINIRRSAK